MLERSAGSADPGSVTDAGPTDDGRRRAVIDADPQDGGRGQRRTTLVSIVAAVVLVVLKLGVGLVTGSLGLISAGIESVGDVVAATVTFFAVRLGSQPADHEHPYGHRRAENLGALAEAGILIAGGTVVTIEAIGRLASGHEHVDAGWYVFAVIVVAMTIDVLRMTTSLKTSRRYASAALRSNAFHFGGDMAGSIAVLIGLVLVAVGFPAGDAIAALVVAAIIFSAAGRLVYENARVLMDTAPQEAQHRAETALDGLGAGVELRRLRLRESGGRYFADVTVAVDPGQAVVEGHQTADEVEDALRTALPGSDVVVHLEPRDRGLDLRQRALAVALAEPLVSEAHDITIYEQAGGGRSLSLHLKLPPAVSLTDAHEVAERIEATLREEPRVGDVQTHLEPLEQPVAAAADARGRDAGERARISDAVEERTGQPPREVRLLRTPLGLVVFLTVPVAESTPLAAAHRLASALENDIRRGRAGIAEVVVHTEP